MPACRPLLLSLLIVLVACEATTDEDVADDLATVGALSETLPIGTELVTTSNVNLRSGPSASSAIVRVLAKGTTVVTVDQIAPTGAFYAVKAGADRGWVHGSYVTKSGGSARAPAPSGCVERRLRFSADALPALPADSAWVWGGNATGGDRYLDPPYAPDFLARASAAHAKKQLVFAYLEGPCGDTGGVDDGERARCAAIHDAFNQRFAPGTPNTPSARWKPFTMKQLRMSGALGVDFCEIDNLDNAVTIPLNPLLREIKTLFDGKEVHCRLVLKNVDVAALDALRADVAPTTDDADFLAPFAIYEADDTSAKPALDAAMRRLKGPGAVTVISTDTNHYGSGFTPDHFLTCD